jgi:hypothetical protein
VHVHRAVHPFDLKIHLIAFKHVHSDLN